MGTARKVEGTLDQLSEARLALAMHYLDTLVVLAEVPALASLPAKLRTITRAHFSKEAERTHGTRLEALEVLTRTSLPALRSLTVMDGWLTKREAALLVAAPWAKQLEELVLEGHPLGDEGAAALFGGSTFPALRTLRLHGCDLHRPVLHLPRLERLDLSHNDLAPDSLAALQAPALNTLSLRTTGLTDEGTRWLAQAPQLAPLVELDLFDNTIGPAGGVALAGSKVLTSLQRLDLTRNKLLVEGVAAFARPGALPALKRLAITFNEDGTSSPYLGGDGCLNDPSDFDILYALGKVFSARTGLELATRLTDEPREMLTVK
jgi:Leucine-rich repeat (LRR) protein